MFPHALQGVDLVVYNVFTSLGLEVKIRPLLDISKELDEMDEMSYEFDEDSYGDSPDEFYWDWTEYECSCGDCFPAFPSFKEWKVGKPHGDLIGYKFEELKFCQSREEPSFHRQYKEEVCTPIRYPSTLSLLTLNDPSSCRRLGNSRDTTISSGWMHREIVHLGVHGSSHCKICPVLDGVTMTMSSNNSTLIWYCWSRFRRWARETWQSKSNMGQRYCKELTETDEQWNLCRSCMVCFRYMIGGEWWIVSR